MKSLSVQRLRPSIEIWILAAERAAVNEALVNWLPWSVLKISVDPVDKPGLGLPSNWCSAPHQWFDAASFVCLQLHVHRHIQHSAC
jgi:hypothetical protein